MTLEEAMLLLAIHRDLRIYSELDIRRGILERAWKLYERREAALHKKVDAIFAREADALEGRYMAERGRKLAG